MNPVIADTSTMHPVAASTPVVEAIFIYPIKSCQGIAVKSADMSATGFLHDRRWCIVSDLHNEAHVENQFEMHPKLASIKPTILGDTHGSQMLQLTAPGMPLPLHLPIRTTPDPARRCNPVGAVQRTHMKGDVEDEGEDASVWLTSLLAQGPMFTGLTFHLVWCPPYSGRELATDPRFGELFRPSETTAFADTAQYLLTSLSSLEALNQHIQLNQGPEGAEQSTVPMARFRPNIVISGLPAFAEDYFASLRIGGQSLRVCMPALRCNVTTIIQSGENAGTRPSAEPLESLGSLRTGELRGGRMFGVKLCSEVDLPPIAHVRTTVDLAHELSHELQGAPRASSMPTMHPVASTSPSPVIRVGDRLDVERHTHISLMDADITEMSAALRRHHAVALL